MAPGALLVTIAGVVAALLAGHAPRSASGSGPTARPSPPRAAIVVPCHERIATLRRNPIDGGHVVGGNVVLPPAFRQPPVRVHDGRWRGWAKDPLAVRAGAGPVTVAVAPGWRDRAALTWGWGDGPSQAAAVRFARCGAPGGGWRVYAGGVFTRGGSLCLPLVIRDGDRSWRARIGVGRRCRR